MNEYGSWGKYVWISDLHGLNSCNNAIFKYL